MNNSNDRRALRLLLALAAVCLIALPVAALAEVWFGEAIYSTIPYEPYNFAVGDLNGDGVDDVAYVTGSVGSNHLVVLINDGAGVLQPTWTYPGAGYTVGLGDFNQDGSSDIVGATTPTATVFFNDGCGSFSEGAVVDPPGHTSIFVATGDLDLDGLDDLVICTGTHICVYWQGPGGLLEPPGLYTHDMWPQYPACLPVTPEEIVINDATGDGRPDVVIVGNVPNGFCLPEELFRGVGILENLGGRAFTDSVSWVLAEQFDGYWWYHINVADFNGDNLPDISVEPNDYGVRIYYRDEAGHYTMDVPGLSWSGSGHTSGDVDGNGIVDVITDRGGISSRAYRGNGDGTFLIAQSDMAAAKGPQLGQLDQNEGLDVVGFNGATMRVLPNILFLTSYANDAPVSAPEQIRVVPTVLSHGACTILAPAAESSVTAAFLVTDLAGRLVTTLSASRASSTHLRATWDGRDNAGRDVPTGWYWIRHGDRTARAGRVLWIR